MSSTARNVVSAALIVLVAFGLAIAFLRPTSEVIIDPSDPVTGIESATVDTALVTSKREKAGFRFLGITFSSSSYDASVTFTAPEECLEVIERATGWPTGDPRCGPAGSLTGDIAGTGRTAEGRAIVSVAFEVNEQCWDAIETGDRWDRAPESCRG